MRTGKSLGTMSDVAAPAPPVLDSDTRIEALERRVATLEALLNDVMQQLDRPFRDQHSKQNGTPKQAKPKPKHTPPKQAVSPADQPPPISEEQKQAE